MVMSTRTETTATVLTPDVLSELDRVGDAAASANLGSVVQAIADGAREILGISSSGALVAHEDGGRVLAISAHHGLRHPQPEEILVRLRTAAAGRTTFYCNDTSRDAAFAWVAGEEDSSIVGAVLPIGLGFVGAVWGVDRSVERFDESSAQMLESFSRHAFMWALNIELVSQRSAGIERLNRLNDTVKKIAGSRELRDLLPEIVADAARLVGAASGDMLLLDEKRSTLAVAGVWNLPPEMLDFEMPFGEGVSSRAIENRQPIPISDYESYPHRVRRLDHYAFRAVLSVPLISRGEAIGALNIHRDQVGYRFSQDEIDLLSAFADHAAVAIDTAQRYENEKQLTSHLQELNEVTRQQNVDLQRALEVQDRLTHQVLTNQGLQAIARELAALLARPVLVHDHNFRRLTAVSESGDDIEPADLEELVRADRTFLEGVVGDRRTGVLQSSDGEIEFLVGPLVAGDEVLGFVTVVDARGLEAVDRALMNVAITGLSLELMKVRTQVEIEHRLRGDFFKDLFEKRYDDIDLVQARASYLGYPLDRPYDVAFVGIRDSSPANGQGTPARLIDFIHREAGNLVPGSLAVQTDEGVVILLATDITGGDRSESHDCLHRIVTATRSWYGTIGPAVLSERCVVPDDFASAVSAARDTCAVLTKFGDFDVVADAVEPSLVRLLLKASQGEELLAFARSMIQPLIEYDEEHSSQLLPTLRLYLANGCNQRRAAEAGFLHPNTMAYRLKRAAAILERDPSDPDVALDLRLALSIIDLLPSRRL